METGTEREAEAAETKDTEITELLNWQRVVALVQEAFGEGRLADEATC